MNSRWYTYALCADGHVVERVGVADLFHVHSTVCPECGGSRDGFRLAVGRYVSQGWFTPARFEERQPGSPQGGQ